MTRAELEAELSGLSENEIVEFKEWTGTFSVFGTTENKKCIYAYLVALGNEGEGSLYVGVKDNAQIVGTSGELPEDFKQKIFQLLKVRVVVERVEIDGGKKVFVIRIPRHPLQDVYRFYGVPMMRVDDELREMDTQTLRTILNEASEDFSAKFVPNLTLDDLDLEAIALLRNRYYSKTNNPEINTLPTEQLLRDLELMRGGLLTYSALILLGKEEKISEYLDDAEIVFEYRNTAEQITFSERKELRHAFLLSLEEVWEDINLHNQVHQYQEGLVRRDVSSFNGRVMREALLNAVVHRDYQRRGSVFIRQNPDQIIFESPGGFMMGITPSNVIDQQSWRNRRLAEVLSKLGYIERSGQGVDLIYKENIQEGKGLPSFLESDLHKVVLEIPASVSDFAFIQYLERIANDKQCVFSVRELITLQRIKDGDPDIKRSEVSRFLEMGIVEKVGRTNDARYILSRHYYQSSNQTGRYIRIKGLQRDVKKQLIIEYLKENKKGVRVLDLIQAFPELVPKDISNFLQELKKQGVIEFEGITKSGVWKLAKE